MAKKVFKAYHQGQLMLLPPSLEEMIEANHPARVVNQIINQIDIAPLEKKYKGGGTSSYHPRMLLKVLVYAYLTNTYSSRKIEAALKENIHFMWLSGMSKPDHNTINRFRSDRLQDVLKQVFSQVVLLLVDHGLIDLKEAYLDGTKMEANANRYTFVWGKAIRTSKERIRRQIDELWQYARQVAAEELSDTEPLEFAQISPEKVQQTIEEIDQALKDKPVDKKVKQKLQYARKNWPKNLERYEQQEQQLGSRNNMSKSDPDASFMRMKEDHMKNGQLKPGYNLQLSTQHQFILNYTLHQSSTDTATLPAHMDSYRELFDQMPEVLTADAGYGSEENYHYLEQNRVEAFVKYNYFHLEQKGGHRRNPFSQTYLHYNVQLDCYYCPMGQPMTLCGKRQRKTDNGYLQTNHLYQAQNCRGCPMRGGCHKQQGNRIIEVNHRLRKYKEMARERLLSELGILHRKKRPAEVEAVFGCIKHNKGFRRFMLKGLRKVAVETGLLAIAHNLSKMAN